MPVANVRSRWNAGVLEFYDRATGTTVFSVDGPNLAVTFAELVASNFTFPTVARTATADGLTTGTIADAGLLQFVPVTSANAAHIVVLPTPTPGTIVVLAVGANGFELRSSAPATVAINGGAESAAESAIAANSLVIAVCTSATTWQAIGLTGTTLAAVEAAAAA